MNFTKIVKNS